MRDINYKEWAEKISAVLAVVLFYGIMEYCGITCPIKYITGISCAGCGMSRAWFALLRMDVSAAYAYHPLFFMPPVIVLMLLLKKKTDPAVFRGMIIFVIVLFGAVYLYRMCQGTDNIVVFEPQNGLIGRFLLRIRQS